MKTVSRIFTFALLASYLQACTPKVLQLANGTYPIDPDCPQKGYEEANPWWYVSLPITIPLDIMGLMFVIGFEREIAGVVASQKENNHSCEITRQEQQVNQQDDQQK